MTFKLPLLGHLPTPNLLIYTCICTGFCVSDGGSADPSSDWSAPAEVWGNYEEPRVEPPLTLSQSLPETAKVNLLIAAAVSVPQLPRLPRQHKVVDGTLFFFPSSFFLLLCFCELVIPLGESPRMHVLVLD